MSMPCRSSVLSATTQQVRLPMSRRSSPWASTLRPLLPSWPPLTGTSLRPPSCWPRAAVVPVAAAVPRQPLQQQQQQHRRRRRHRQHQQQRQRRSAAGAMAVGSAAAAVVVVVAVAAPTKKMARAALTSCGSWASSTRRLLRPWPPPAETSRVLPRPCSRVPPPPPQPSRPSRPCRRRREGRRRRGLPEWPISEVPFWIRFLAVRRTRSNHKRKLLQHQCHLLRARPPAMQQHHPEQTLTWMLFARCP
mmetsp:Transcript_168006/g.534424  ORF Transcript_168006/g.534424 Transcript_168006/m.534424 type:complete len:248 (+) Transcript_168006:2060-2803(+)